MNRVVSSPIVTAVYSAMLLSAFLCLTAAAGDAAPIPETLTFQALTNPLPLYPGEVTNTFHKLPIPPGPIAIYEFSADVVEYHPTKSNEIIPVPLSEAYLHHHVVTSEHESYKHMKHWWAPMKPVSAMRNVGFGAGTESRGTVQRFPYPFAFTTVKGENELIANVHVINTRNMKESDSSHCLECPCSSHDVNEEDGLILESVAQRRKSWSMCNVHLMEEHNTACSLHTYKGGLLCCEDGEFCLDKFAVSSSNDNVTRAEQQDGGEGGNAADDNKNNKDGGLSTFYLRYTLTYAPTVSKENIPLMLAACCDASGNMTKQGNIEYDIPQLCTDKDKDNDTTTNTTTTNGTTTSNNNNNDINDECLHTLSTVQILHGPQQYAFGGALYEEDREVDVVYMVGHLHRGGINITAYDETTGEVICQSLPTYGTGAPNEIGNETGYIIAMSHCTFDPPRRMRTTNPIRITSYYDARKAHTGVMSLFYIAIADIPENAQQQQQKEEKSLWGAVFFITLFSVAVVGVVKVSRRYGLYGFGFGGPRWGYEMVPNTNNAPPRGFDV